MALTLDFIDFSVFILADILIIHSVIAVHASTETFALLYFNII